MTKQPDQALHDKFFSLAQSLGYKVYLTLPPDKTPYPFVVMGESHLMPRATKSYLVGKVNLTVHVWGSIKSRQTVSEMMGRLLTACGGIGEAGGYRWAIQSSDSRMIKDNSTLEPLYHGVLDMDFHFR